MRWEKDLRGCGMSDLETLGDAELAARLKTASRDEASDLLDVVLERHGKDLMNYLFRKMGVPSKDAEALLYSTIQTAYEKIGTYDQRNGGLGAWLTGIARHHALHKIREDAAKKRVAVQFSGDTGFLEDRATAPDEREAREKAAEIRAVVGGEIAKLPDLLHRDILETIVLLGDDPAIDAGIAQRHGFTVGYVRVQRSVAKSMLREALVKIGFPYRLRGGK